MRNIIKKIINEENGQKGFSIVEVIVSIAILTIGILAVARMQTVAVRGTTLAKRLSVDAIGAQDIIERVVSVPYDDPLIVDTGGNDVVFVDDPVHHYTLSMNIADDTPVTNTKTIRVTVVSNAPGGSKTTPYDFIKARLP